MQKETHGDFTNAGLKARVHSQLFFSILVSSCPHLKMVVIAIDV